MVNGEEDASTGVLKWIRLGCDVNLSFNVSSLCNQVSACVEVIHDRRIIIVKVCSGHLGFVDSDGTEQGLIILQSVESLFANYAHSFTCLLIDIVDECLDIYK